MIELQKKFGNGVIKMPKITIIIPLGENKETDFIENFDKEKTKAKVIIVKGSNPSKNRNRGAKSAKTELVAFVNGHTTLSDNWINEVEKFFLENPKIDVLGGPQLSPKDSSFFERITGNALSSKFGAADVSSRYKLTKLNLDADELSITSANLICKREVLDKVEFDETVYPGEDPKFIRDVKKQGFRVAYSPKIVAYNKRRRNVTSLIKQIYMYGFTRPKKESLSDTFRKPYFIVPSLFLIYIMALISMILFIEWKFLALIPLMLYILLDLVSSISNSIKNKEILPIFVLPFVYLIIHISYGLGFLVSTIIGIFKKRK